MKKIIAACILVVAVSYALAAVPQKKVGDGQEVVYEQGFQWKMFPALKPVTSFAVVNNSVWYATEAGLYSQDITRGVKPMEYSTIASVPSAGVSVLAVDATNNIWIGTASGAVQKSNSGFKLFNTENGLSDNTVNAILPLKNGKIWVGTNNGACVYQAGAWTTYSSAQGLAGDEVRACAVDKNGTVWLGTNKGISSFDGTTWTSHTMNNGLSWNDTKAIACDPRNGNVWAAVGDKDINCYEVKNKAWKVFMEVGAEIRCIMVDTQGRVWIGTADGLMKFNGDEWVSDPQKIGITANKAAAMFRDEQGNLWFGMETGVLKLNNPYPY
jgi:ligand-binding sensor domain-containing protein